MRKLFLATLLWALSAQTDSRAGPAVDSGPCNGDCVGPGCSRAPGCIEPRRLRVRSVCTHCHILPSKCSSAIFGTRFTFEPAPEFPATSLCDAFEVLICDRPLRTHSSRRCWVDRSMSKGLRQSLPNQNTARCRQQLQVQQLRVQKPASRRVSATDGAARCSSAPLSRLRLSHLPHCRSFHRLRGSHPRLRRSHARRRRLRLRRPRWSPDGPPGLQGRRPRPARLPPRPPSLSTLAATASANASSASPRLRNPTRRRAPRRLPNATS